MQVWHLRVIIIDDKDKIVKDVQCAFSCKSCKNRYDDARWTFPGCNIGCKENQCRGLGCKKYVFDKDVL